MKKIRIDKINLQWQEYECWPVNLILWPNNVGKSTLLNELHAIFTQMQVSENNYWIKWVQFWCRNIESYIQGKIWHILKYISFNDVPKEEKEIVMNITWKWFSNWEFNQFKTNAWSIPKEFWIHVWWSTNNWFIRHYKFLITMNTIFESCETRLSEKFLCETPSIEHPINTVVDYLFKKESSLNTLSSHIYDVFKYRIGFDDLPVWQHPLRAFSPWFKKPSMKLDTIERSKKREEWWPVLSKQWHWLRAYCKIAMSIIVGDKSFVLIDEPESFLHPPQRRSLWKFIVDHVGAWKQVFIVTHDSELIRWILLEWISKVRVFHLKEKNEVKYSNFKRVRFWQSINYSTQILNWYFTKKTVFTESEVDKLIYERTVQKFYGDKIEQTNFIWLNGVASVIKTMAETKKKFWLDAFWIVDCDYLLTLQSLNSLGLSREEKKKVKMIHKYHNKLQQNYKDSFTRSLKKKWISFLKKESNDLYTRWLEAIKILEEKWIYVVKYGEIESLFPVNEKAESIFNEIISIIDNYKKKGNPKVRSFIKKVI